MKTGKALLLATLFFTLGIAGKARAEHFGAVNSFLQGGETTLGIVLSYDAEEWKSNLLPGTLEFRQKQVAAQLALGLGKGWAATVRGGVQDLDIEDDTNDFNAGPRPFVGAAFGGPLYRGKILSIGPMVHGEYSLKYEDNGAEVKNLLKGTAALMGQLEIEGASLYFGPTITLSDGRYTDSSGVEGDLETDRRYAALAGVRWLLPDNWPTDTSKTYLDFELRFKDDMSGSLALNFTY
jgi:hypothetical protein